MDLAVAGELEFIDVLARRLRELGLGDVAVRELSTLLDERRSLLGLRADALSLAHRLLDDPLYEWTPADVSGAQSIHQKILHLQGELQRLRMQAWQKVVPLVCGSRIAEIARSAGLRVSPDGTILPAFWGGVSEGYARFAALLIQECLGACERLRQELVGTDDWSVTRDAALADCISEISRLFEAPAEGSFAAGVVASANGLQGVLVPTADGLVLRVGSESGGVREYAVRTASLRVSVCDAKAFLCERGDRGTLEKWDV